MFQNLEGTPRRSTVSLLFILPFVSTSFDDTSAVSAWLKLSEEDSLRLRRLWIINHKFINTGWCYCSSGYRLYLVSCPSTWHMALMNRVLLSVLTASASTPAASCTSQDLSYFIHDTSSSSVSGWPNRVPFPQAIPPIISLLSESW
jgi:hypothetical protein